MTVYLDHNATTPPAPEVVEAIAAVMTDGFGNAASSHVWGRRAAVRVDRAREQVAALLGVAPQRLVWTSGATEALNTALVAATQQFPRLAVARTEHKAVLDTAEYLRDKRGVEVEWLDVDHDGRVTVESLAALTLRSPYVLAVMAANNETGVLNDVAGLSSVVHAAGGVVVCDVTQQAGKLPVDLNGWNIDFAAASAHKLYGPQGVGVLVAPLGRDAVPLIHGGQHQRGWRSGTLNVPGIVGFGVAAERAVDLALLSAPRTSEHRDSLQRLLESELGPLPVHGGGAPRLPNTLNVRIPGVDADAMIVNCPKVAFSSGSACTSSVPAPSHVLLAMGVASEHAEQSIRLSLGSETTSLDIELAARELAAAATRLRELNGWEA